MPDDRRSMMSEAKKPQSVLGCKLGLPVVRHHCSPVELNLKVMTALHNTRKYSSSMTQQNLEDNLKSPVLL